MQHSPESIDHSALAALGAIVVGWFFMATLRVDFGLWQKSIHFYEVWAVIQDPAGQLSGLNHAGTGATLGFGVVCVAALLAPAACILYRRPAASLTYLIPFVVMAVSGAVLYAKGSMTTIVADADSHSASAYLARMAQAAMGRASDAVATRVSAGAGSYVALLCCCFLVLRGLARFRAEAAARKPDSGYQI